MARPDARQRLAEALLVEGLEQIVHGADLECLERVGVVGGDEYQGRQLLQAPRARARFDAVQRVHLDVEEQQLRLSRSNGGERGRAVAELAHHAQIAFRLAIFAQGAPARRSHHRR